ncbi:hypothetical protein [Desulfobacter curvatus]|uniref:hypothetical protein n=1 Tax=Desulfobacter curvatus TaxID=2290 RepID=UPI00037C7CD9|nr:hypothetical protein [Desulfobacter curvatus]
MDFSDFITLILFFVFIFAPFLKRKKKVQTPDKSKPSGFSVLGKIREALKDAAMEMQAQAEQARKKEASGQSKQPHERSFEQPGKDPVNQTFWDEIDDREDVDFYPGNADVHVLEQIEPVDEKPLCVPTGRGLHRKAANRPETRESKSIGQGTMQRHCNRSGSRRLPARARGLRKAVIWSEILRKPVALRNSDSL